MMNVQVIDHIATPDAGLQAYVLDMFQTHTGYARADLVPDADFESDLGIDSVTLATTLAELYKALGLSSRQNPQHTSTIALVLAHIGQCLEQDGKTLALPRRPGVPEHAADALTTALIAAYSRHTGYKPSDLVLDAELESDLGIDSVTQAAVLSELAKLLGIAAVAFPTGLSSIAQVIAHLRPLVHLEMLEPAAPAIAVPPATEEKQCSEFIDKLGHADASAPSVAAEPTADDARTMRDFVNIPHRDLFHKAREFNTFYQRKQQEQLYWYGMPLESRCSNRAVIYDEVSGKRREFLMFASNNYLGLANHPEVIEAIVKGVREYGATNTGCRLIGGTNVLHMELERRLAKLKGRQACIVYPSGYSANLGCISALAGQNDLIFTDALNHMSIQDGCKLAGAARKIYPHDLYGLEKILQKHADHDGGKLIVTDGVFSMHGDVVDLPRLVALAKQYGARVLVDDAHSTGVLGRTGSGTTEHFGMKGAVDLEVGTMSKTLAGVGGFVCGDEEVVDYLRFYSHSYVFAATIPAAVAAGLIAAIDVMEREPQRISKLWRNVHHLRGHLLEAGFDLEHSASAIIPVVVGDDRKTLEFGRAARARGMYCQTVVFPGVAVGDARLRISVSSEHTVDDLDEAAQILVDAAKEVGVAVRG